MQHDVPARLQHILDAGEELLEITAGKTFDDYARDRVLRRAVERLFSIIGEALREAAKLEPAIQPRVTAYRKIVDFRNILVHGYAEVYNESVWERIANDLPLLLTEVRGLLNE
ncbi:MAG TPA: HepT-like ribonuclease domain-containing protein [Thermoanaerobaculia bacterium]|jgi:uncharacterized protein with HEPN domain